MKAFLTFVTLCVVGLAHAQEADTLRKQLDEVVITGYLSRQPLLRVAASAAVLNARELSMGSQQSLVPVMNTVPGVSMEERSPGSYRLSIRGSLLRSPFGIRNVKIYLNDLPFTDASGNIYLNLIDPVMLQRVEILKGPDGSLFGANSGGVVLMETHQRDSAFLNGSLSGGTYGLFRQHVAAGGTARKLIWNLTEAYQRSDGYRQQSAMNRLSLLGSGKLHYGAGNSLNLTALFSDLQYETPGGLTENLFEENPRLARPRVGVVPGAVEQNTGIFNTTFFGGLSHEANLPAGVRWVMSGFGTITHFRNPFINNYEIRKEKNAGLRTFVKYRLTAHQFAIDFYAGTEAQFGNQHIANYENSGGTRGALLEDDAVALAQAFYFTKVTFDWAERLTVETALSLNNYRYTFRGNASQTLSNEWMPRVAVSYRVLPGFAVRVSASRGYSPPTIAEIRPSGMSINTNLDAESGWNKEAGTRLALLNGRFQADASVFRYDLTNAIVRRTEEDAEFFLNSGGTKQTGAELLLNSVLVTARTAGLIRKMSARVSYTYSRFVFSNYRIDEADYSGNRVTGVPRTQVVASVSMDLPQRLHLFVQATSVSRLPLNDGNLVFADPYQLLQARIGWTAFKSRRFSFELFGGGDNLLNQTYSLGYDLNAFGGRYYNAAPLRNFYAGIKVMH